nr:DUF2852 domain-containing protein [uncultured Rhodopila sp.]
MTSAVNQDAYGNSGWGQAPRGDVRRDPWGAQSSGHQIAEPPPFWHPAGMSRPVAIGATVLGFILWWPIGLALLFYLMGSGRMGCAGSRKARYRSWQESSPFSDWKSWSYGGSRSASSGNHAFDDYKTETLRRLEDEQKEFASFLERLRFARDKAEFDQFMAERRSRPASDEPSAA